jgi:hypothetical protein
MLKTSHSAQIESINIAKKNNCINAIYMLT